MANTLMEIVEKNEPATELGKIDGWQMLWPIETNKMVALQANIWPHFFS